MADLVIVIVVPLVLLKIGIWICCCYARNKRQSQLNQQGVIVYRPTTAVTQTNVMRLGDGNGIVVNELPSPVTSPQYGFQAEGHASHFTHCTGITQDKHPTTNSFPWDSFQPQFPIHTPPNYEEALKSGSV